jgi:hypothetical protein
MQEKNEKEINDTRHADSQQLKHELNARASRYGRQEDWPLQSLSPMDMGRKRSWRKLWNDPAQWIGM